MQKSSTFLQPQGSIPDRLSSYIRSLILGSQSLSQAKQAHAQATLRGLLLHLPICAALILTYSDFQQTPTSRRLFEQTPLKYDGSAFLWNTLVRSYTKAGLHAQAFGVYNRMASSAVRPDDRTFPFLLKACADAAAFPKGREVHGSVVKSGFGADVFVGNTLLAFYGVFSSAMSDVRRVFDDIPQRDIVSWNSLLSVFSVNGYLSESLGWFLELTRTGLMVNSVSVVSILPACAALRDVVFGEEIHGFVIKVGLDSQVTVGNAFVDMYGKCGDLEGSRQVFWSMPEKNDVSWNAVVGSLVHAGLPIDALSMFRAMLAGEMRLNSITVSILLPALVELRFFDMGKEVHGYSIRTGMDHDVFVANSLVDMYSKSGCVKEASEIFYGMDRRNVVTWNAMIANFAQNRAELESIRLIREMQVNGEYPNAVTFTNILPACARIAALKHGKEIHAKSIREGSCFDLFVTNALMDMYVKCGCLNLAGSVFVISEKDEVSYNTLIVGHSQSRHCSEALHLFLEMGFVGLKYDVVSFMGVLSACANLSAIKQGKEIHGLSVRKLFHNHLFVANSLLDLYTKNGHMQTAKRIFDQISNKDVASWNAIILGYGMQGEFRVAVDMFDLMKDGNIECDSVSYIAVLSACSHGGLVERGKGYFDQMLSQNIKPTQMHYACMVDLLGRAGLMEEVKDFINGMTLEPDSNVWGALLGACRVYGNLELGRWAAEHLFELKPGHCGYYILLSNMYAEAGRWDEANEIRKLIKSRGVKKNPGCSWVEVDRRMHAFVVGERLEEPGMESRTAESGQGIVR